MNISKKFKDYFEMRRAGYVNVSTGQHSNRTHPRIERRTTGISARQQRIRKRNLNKSIMAHRDAKKFVKLRDIIHDTSRAFLYWNRRNRRLTCRVIKAMNPA